MIGEAVIITFVQVVYKLQSEPPLFQCSMLPAQCYIVTSYNLPITIQAENPRRTMLIHIYPPSYSHSSLGDVLGFI